MIHTFIGLTSKEAELRQTKYGLNILPQQKAKTPVKILLDIIKEPMISLLIIGGCFYLWLGDSGEAIMLFVMIGGVSGITFLQENRTEKAIQSLKAISSPKCRVIRNGQESVIDSSLVVPGDIIRVVEGERVAADAKILTSTNVTVDESVLTGESLPAVKSPDLHLTEDLLTQPNMIYSSTLVKSGWAIAEVVSTGLMTQTGKIGMSLKQIQEHPTRIQQETNQIVKFAAAFGILVSAFVVVGLGMMSGRWTDGVLQGIAIAMSMLPEEFPVVLTIFMALGAAKIAKKQVLMRHLPALETLGSATVLCVDKTGTLTKNHMELNAVADKKTVTESFTTLSYTQEEVIRIGYRACQEHQDDPMEMAITQKYREFPQEKEHSLLQKHYPIEPPHLYMANVWKRPHGQYLIAVKGAPESIITLCHSTLRIEEKAHIQALIDERAACGMRLLAVAESGNLAHWSESDNLETIPFHFVGLLVFSDPIRDEAPAAIQQCAAAGIRTMMITGDYQHTAKTIGDQLGLPGADQIITGKEVRETPQKRLRHVLAATSICARIMPEQKLKIVQTLQANGEVVAMTGDGINDAPALKAANMGIAMGKRGTDVAREAADMVLLDDSFTSIVHAVFEGRLIFDNIRKAIGFVMSIHLPIAVMSIVPLFFGLPPLLTPVHVVILELIIDPACTLVFEAEPAESSIMTRPPRNPQDNIFNKQLYIKSLIYGAIVCGAVFAAYYVSQRLTDNPEILRTTAFVTLICTNCLLITAYRSERSLITILRSPNKAFWAIMSGVALFLLAVIYLPAFRDVMHMTLLQPKEVLIVVRIFIGAFLLIEVMKRTPFLKFSTQKV